MKQSHNHIKINTIVGQFFSHSDCPNYQQSFEAPATAVRCTKNSLRKAERRKATESWKTVSRPNRAPPTRNMNHQGGSPIECKLEYTLAILAVYGTQHSSTITKKWLYLNKHKGLRIREHEIGFLKGLENTNRKDDPFLNQSNTHTVVARVLRCNSSIINICRCSLHPGFLQHSFALWTDFESVKAATDAVPHHIVSTYEEGNSSLLSLYDPSQGQWE